VACSDRAASSATDSQNWTHSIYHSLATSRDTKESGVELKVQVITTDLDPFHQRQDERSRRGEVYVSERRWVSLRSLDHRDLAQRRARFLGFKRTNPFVDLRFHPANPLVQRLPSVQVFANKKTMVIPHSSRQRLLEVFLRRKCRRQFAELPPGRRTNRAVRSDSGRVRCSVFEITA